MPWTPGFPRLRATKLSPLLWMIFVFSSPLVGTGWGTPSLWIQVLLAVLLVLTFGQMLFAYNYLLIYDRPSLSSEEHEQAMARIQKGITGDNAEGFGKMADQATVTQTPIRN
jgi:hypothetical protein